MEPPRIVVLADDLSGAAECAAALLPVMAEVPVLLDRDGALPAAEAVVIDLDSRELLAPMARDAVRAAATGRDLVVKKMDSLLRGNVAAEVAGLLEPAGRVVLSPALPALGRTVRDGVLHIDGRPLHETELWGVERGPAPQRVPDVLAPLPVVEVSLAELRSGALPGLLDRDGVVYCCDAEEDADLDRMVAAAVTVPGSRLVGSAAVVAALARRMAAERSAPRPATPGASGPTGRFTGTSPGPRRLLAVVGTASARAKAQVAVAVEAGVPCTVLDSRLLIGAEETALRGLGHALAQLSWPRVLTITEAGELTAEQQSRLTAHLAVVVGAAVDALPATVDLVLTGGATARAVLDRLAVPHLVAVRELHTGAVESRTPDGAVVLTRPGSYGDDSSLLTLIRAGASVGPASSQKDQRERRYPMSHTAADLPLVAVTMGDGAGVGPEVTVGALARPEAAGLCRAVVIGDAARLRQAARILGLDVDVVAVAGPEDASFEPGVINVIDLGLLPEDLPWGEISPVAGDAAYQYVKVAAELAVEGRVHAICTAPLNKAALHAGGHLFPGHTEMLAHLTGTPEVSMMLSCPQVKVIHVTTHIGLIDAVAKIEPGLVERTVRRGYQALVRSGVEDPRIGVCAINPHAGENGLFGYGEEAEKITPAIEVLRADGIRAEGPLPADTAFFLASRGDYDLIVAMYHDQGHGPVKVLGIEDGVNITVGLPVIRTSVDHGTAFDIAGTGSVQVGSMVEALRQAALLATRPVIAG